MFSPRSSLKYLININSIIFNITFFKLNGGSVNLTISARINLVTKLLYVTLRLTSNRLDPYTTA